MMQNFLMKLWKHFKWRIIQKGDTILFDKGYCSYKNYQLGSGKYKTVPFIFPKNNFNKTKLND